MARPPLPRYRADLIVEVAYSADGPADAEARLEELLAELRPRLAKLIGARRIGACELRAVYGDQRPLPLAPNRDPEPLLERLTATREDLAP